LDVCGVEEREEGVPCRVKMVVSCLKEDWGVWRRKNSVPE
jgi:hypothetical protein